MAKDPFWTSETEAAFARIAIDHSRDGIAIISGGERVFVNEAWLNIFRINEIAEPLKIPPGKFAVDEENKELFNQLEFSETSGPTEPALIKIFRSDGDPRVLEGYSRPFTYRGKPSRVVFLADITVRKMAEAQVARHAKDLIEALNDLRDSEERFRIVVENLKEYSICLLDSVGNITSWNKSGELLEGYKREEIVGKYCSVFFSNEDASAGKPSKILEYAVANGTFHERGIRTKKGGSQFQADVTINVLKDREGKILGFSRIVREITN